MLEVVLYVLVGVLAVQQTAWALVYGTGPWRSTDLGWVWLLKGSLIALLWWLLLTNTAREVSDWVWLGLLIGLNVATAAWLWATIRARWGSLR